MNPANEELSFLFPQNNNSERGVNGLIHFYGSLTFTPTDANVNIHNVNYFSTDHFSRNAQ